MALSDSRELGEDMMREVMVRLPVKSLLRFKSVSKSWYARISSPDFIAEHLQIWKSVSSNSRTHMIIREDDCPTPGNGAWLISRKSQQDQQGPPAVDDDDDDGGMEIELPLVEKGLIVDAVHGQCDGIFCLEGFFPNPHATTPPPSMCLLWNPATREVRILPRDDEIKMHPWDDDDSEPFYGFGMDLIRKHYKVVRLNGRDSFETMWPPLVKVYNLSANDDDTWTRTLQHDSCVPTHFDLQGVPDTRTLLNGRYHWLGEDRDDWGYSDIFWVIVFFDFSTEILGTMQGPPTSFDFGVAFLVVVDDTLALIDRDSNESFFEFDVWVMTEYGVESSWTKKFKIGLQPYFDSFFLFWGHDHVLGTRPHGRDKSELVSYNLTSQNVRRIHVCGVSSWFAIHEYTQSLVPLSRGGGRGTMHRRRVHRWRRVHSYRRMLLFPSSSERVPGRARRCKPTTHNGKNKSRRKEY